MRRGRQRQLEEREKRTIHSILRVFQEALHFLNNMRDYLQYHFKEPLTLELIGGVPPTEFSIRRWNSDMKAAEENLQKTMKFLTQELSEEADLKPRRKQTPPPPEFDDDFDPTFGQKDEVVAVRPLDFLFYRGTKLEIVIYDKRKGVQQIVRRFGKLLANYFEAEVEFKSGTTMKEIFEKVK